MQKNGMQDNYLIHDQEDYHHANAQHKYGHRYVDQRNAELLLTSLKYV